MSAVSINQCISVSARIPPTQSSRLPNQIQAHTDTDTQTQTHRHTDIHSQKHKGTQLVLLYMLQRELENKRKMWGRSSRSGLNEINNALVVSSTTAVCPTPWSSTTTTMDTPLLRCQEYDQGQRLDRATTNSDDSFAGVLFSVHANVNHVAADGRVDEVENLALKPGCHIGSLVDVWDQGLAAGTLFRYYNGGLTSVDSQSFSEKLRGIYTRAAGYSVHVPLCNAHPLPLPSFSAGNSHYQCKNADMQGRYILYSSIRVRVSPTSKQLVLCRLSYEFWTNFFNPPPTLSYVFYWRN